MQIIDKLLRDGWIRQQLLITEDTRDRNPSLLNTFRFEMMFTDGFCQRKPLLRALLVVHFRRS